MANTPQRVYIDISWRALFKILAVVFGILALSYLRDILIMLLVVFIFVAAVNPTIARLQKHMSRAFAVSIFYVVLIACIGTISSLIIPNFAHQFNQLIQALPDVARGLSANLQWLHNSRYETVLQHAANTATNSLSSASSNILSTTYGIVGGLAIAASGFVLSFYLLLEEKNAKDFFYQILPHHRFEAVYETVSKISERMGSWVRGEVKLMLIIGLSNLLVLLVLGVPTPLPLALFAGLCEAIPVIGPLLGVVPAVIVLLTAGLFIKALLMFMLGFIVIQQIEAHIIVPRIMGQAVGLSPVLVIISLLVGAKFFGLLGALIAVPCAAIISVIVGEWPSLRQIWEASSAAEQ